LELQSFIRLVPYDELSTVSRSKPCRGTYIFSDIERLSPAEVTSASALAEALRQSGCRVLNYPQQVHKRFALLKTLHRAGINDFDVYKANEMPKQFPVFIRVANDHDGSRSELLQTYDAVAEQLSALCLAGFEAEDLMLTEYMHTADSTGMYRKYSCFLIGESFIPRHLLFSHNWVTKLWANEVDSGLVQEEIDFINARPHPHEKF